MIRFRRIDPPLRAGQLLDPRLTPRQRQLLRERFRLGSRKEAAAALGISDHTARWHMAELCRRLGVDNAEQAAWVLCLRDRWGEG